jgi:hypothetical protein
MMNRITLTLLVAFLVAVVRSQNPPCNVCGSDQAYMPDGNPGRDFLVVFPPEIADQVPVPQATCGQIFDAGTLLKLFTPENCELVKGNAQIREVLKTDCECVDPNAPEPTDAPVKAPTEAPVPSPTEALVPAPVDRPRGFDWDGLLERIRQRVAPFLSAQDCGPGECDVGPGGRRNVRGRKV